MKPNELGKMAGMTKRDGEDIARAEKKLSEAMTLIKALEETTGRKCEDDEDCAALLKSATAIKEKFFTYDAGEGE